MQKIEAFLPSSIDNEVVSETLFDAGAVSVSITTMRVFDRDQERVENFRGARIASRLIPQVKVEIVVDPGATLPVMTVIQKIFKENEQTTKNVRIFITDLEELHSEIRDTEISCQTRSCR